MNTISIHVSASVAKIYNHADEEEKKKAEQYIDAWLSAFLSGKSPNDQLFEIMKETSDIAKMNGLTPKILEQLLKDES